eukprot:11287659-Ditylum_brightwellii.AAC.1
MASKYRVEVPQNMDAMAKEVQALQDMDCFEFREQGNTPRDDFQKTTLHMLFDCKQDGRRRAQLIAGGHLITLLDHGICLSTVRGISVGLLYILAHSAKLDILCGNIGNV